MIYLELLDETDREMTGTEIFEEIRARTAHFAGITIELKKLEQGPPVGETRSASVFITQQGIAGTGGYPGRGIHENNGGTERH